MPPSSPAPWQMALAGLAIDTRDGQRFSDWVHAQLSTRQVDALLRYRQDQPDALRAQPRDEHLLPLFTAAMDSYVFERAD